MRSPSPAVDMVTRLGPITDTNELAGLLNAAGMTTGHGRPFDAKAVQWIRHAYHIPAPDPYIDGQISVADTAKRLGVGTGTVYDWIKTGKLAARRGPGNRLCIPWTDRVEAECRCRVAESAHLTPRPATPKPGVEPDDPHDVGATRHHGLAEKIDQPGSSHRTIRSLHATAGRAI